jgi:hypothetical protein
MNDELHIGVLLPTGKTQWSEGADPRQLFELAVRAEQLASRRSGPTTRCSVLASRVCRCSRRLRRSRIGSSLAPRP